MKSILTTFLLLGTFLSFGQEEHKIKFVDVELDSAYKLAQAEEKLVFVDCYAVWCGPCKWMDANIFTQKEVADFFNENFVNIKLDMEKGEGEVFAGWYDVRAYPTYVFIDASGRRKEMVHRTVGSMDAERFIQVAKDAMNKNVRLGTAKNEYTAGNRDPEFISSYINQLYKAGLAADAKEIAYWHYNDDVDWNNITSNDAENLLRFVDGPSHKLYPSMMDNLAQLEKVGDADYIYSFLFRAIGQPVWKGIKSDDPAAEYDKAQATIAGLNYGGKDKLSSEIEMYYLREVNMEKYLEVAPTTVTNHFNNNSNVLNSVAWTMYENTKDVKHLKNALKLVERSVELDENFNNLDTKMRLLYATGKKKPAIAIGKDLTVMIDEDESLKNYKSGHEEAMAAMQAGKPLSVE